MKNIKKNALSLLIVLGAPVVFLKGNKQFANHKTIGSWLEKINQESTDLAIWYKDKAQEVNRQIAEQVANDESRKKLLNWVEKRFAEIEADLINCQNNSNRQDVLRKENEDVLSQLRLELGSLNKQVRVLRNNINNTKVAMSAFTALSEENIENSLMQLQALNIKHQEMQEQRDKFKNVLSRYEKLLNAESFKAESFDESLQENFCDTEKVSPSPQ